MSWIIRFIATGFFSSYLTPAPGTVGTLVGLVMYILLPTDPKFYWLFLIVTIFIGIVCSDIAEDIFEQTDSPLIVIDEICGYFVCMAFLPKRLSLIILGFILFRIGDIRKLYPVKQIQSLAGGIGIMADDIFVGIIVNLILHLVHWI